MFFGWESSLDSDTDGPQNEDKCQVEISHESPSKDTTFFVNSWYVHCNVVHQPEKETGLRSTRKFRKGV